MFSRFFVLSIALFGAVSVRADAGDYIVQVSGGCTGGCQSTMSSASGCSSEDLGGSGTASWVLLRCNGRTNSMGTSGGISAFRKAVSGKGVSVSRVEEDTRFKKSELWGIDEVDGRAKDGERCPSNLNLGWRVLVVVLDTGCTPIVRWRNDFEQIKCKNYVRDDGTPSNYCKDGDGHGTHVGGTAVGGIYGVANRADLACMRVLDDNGSGWNSWIIAAVNAVGKFSREQNKGRRIIVNMSLGGSKSTALNNAVIQATRRTRIQFTLAAGNENQNTNNVSPASVGNFGRRRTVGAHDKNGRRASFSNYGRHVSISAPGVGIMSTTPSGVKSWSGTSMAAPHVAGAMAVVWSKRKSPNKSAHLGSSSSRVSYPHGQVNKLRYLC